MLQGLVDGYLAWHAVLDDGQRAVDHHVESRRCGIGLLSWSPARVAALTLAEPGRGARLVVIPRVTHPARPGRGAACLRSLRTSASAPRQHRRDQCPGHGTADRSARSPKISATERWAPRRWPRRRVRWRKNPGSNAGPCNASSHAMLALMRAGEARRDSGTCGHPFPKPCCWWTRACASATRNGRKPSVPALWAK